MAGNLTNSPAKITAKAPGGSDQDISFTVVNSTVQSELLYLDGDGRVGVGTTTPRSTHHISAGASGTTTVEWGDPTSTSQVCHNTKNAEGDEISFYFVGTTMVVENNRCVE